VTTVILNGEECRLPDDATIDVAVAEAGAPEAGHGVAVAIDGEVVPRGEWQLRHLRDGDKVEVLHAVQGGS
jgi:sulfur carrier protein